MPYKHIHQPTLGIDKSIAPADLDARATPKAKGVYLQNGEVVSDFGYVQFPTAGLLKTNKVHGSVMKLYQFQKLDGSTQMVAFTTTNMYQYNTSTYTWDCITQGANAETCESGWTASADVTTTHETAIKLRGTKSVKNVIADAFTTGVAAYAADFGATDFRGNTALHFWVYATTALTASDYAIRLSETTHGGTAGDYTDFAIPAVAANTWTPCCVTGSFTNLNAVISVSLVVNVDAGVKTIYLDDIRAVVKMTGDEDNQYSIATYNDYGIATNGIDAPKKLTLGSTITVASLTTTLAAGAITTSEIALVAKDHVLLMNNTENGADCPQRVSWTNIGQLEDFVNGTAGYQDLTDEQSWIMAAGQLTENVWVIYKEKSIVLMQWVGGQTPFRFATAVYGDGALAKNGFFDLGGVHSVIGNRYLFAYNGGQSVTTIDDKINSEFYSLLSGTYANRAFILYDKENTEIQFWIPTGTAYPDDIYVLWGRGDKPWYRKTRTMTGWGTYISQSLLKFGDMTGKFGEANFRFGDGLLTANFPVILVGDSNGGIFQLSKTTLNNDGAAITNEFETPDFTNPYAGSITVQGGKLTQDQGGDLDTHFRVPQLIFEAHGDSITTEFSTDGGSSWNPTQGAGTNTTTLDSSYKVYQQDFDVVCQKIRFRFSNSTASSGFYMRYYGLKWLTRSNRR